MFSLYNPLKLKIATKKIETKKKMRIRFCAAFVNSIKPIAGSLRSKYIAVKNDANNTKISVIPKIYLYNGIFFIKKLNRALLFF
jgi:hypothetical protein